MAACDHRAAGNADAGGVASGTSAIGAVATAASAPPAAPAVASAHLRMAGYWCAGVRRASRPRPVASAASRRAADLSDPPFRRARNAVRDPGEGPSPAPAGRDRADAETALDAHRAGPDRPAGSRAAAARRAVPDAPGSPQRPAGVEKQAVKAPPHGAYADRLPGSARLRQACKPDLDDSDQERQHTRQQIEAQRRREHQRQLCRSLHEVDAKPGNGAQQMQAMAAVGHVGIGRLWK